MCLIVCMSGFTGAGKTTAVKYLKNRTNGGVLYLGGSVLSEIQSRGMPETRESERLIRLEMRQSDPAVFVKQRATQLDAAIENGISLIVDSIMGIQEYSFITARPGARAFLLEIQAPFQERCRRLAERSDRPLTIEEIHSRDQTELEDLQIERVFAAADRRIVNDSSIEHLERCLDDFLNSVCGNAGSSLPGDQIGRG